MPLYDWECLAHGKFEAFVGKCPHGCSAGMVKRLPVLSLNMGPSGKTKFIDKQMKAIANDLGMTDMSNGGGRSVLENQSEFRWKQDPTNPVLTNPMLTGQPYAVKMSGKDGDVGGMMAEAGIKQGQNALADMRAAGAGPTFKANVVASYTPPKK